MELKHLALNQFPPGNTYSGINSNKIYLVTISELLRD